MRRKELYPGLVLNDGMRRRVTFISLIAVDVGHTDMWEYESLAYDGTCEIIQGAWSDDWNKYWHVDTAATNTNKAKKAMGLNE